MVLLAGALASCDAGGEPVTKRGAALVSAFAASADTFINSAVPDNNDGTSPSIYTGENGQAGLMRGLLQFTLPPALQGRVTVSRVTLTMITRGTGMAETMPPTAATESLQAVGVAWVEGAGFGDGSTANTVGQACGTSGATWNQPNCAGATPWAGGTVSATVSGTATVPSSLETAVTWDSDAPGNAGMVDDVQAWIDSPATNHGWRISSTTEGSMGQAQRFYSREVSGKGPTLSATASCKDADAGCVLSAAADASSSDAAPVDASRSDAGPRPVTSGGGCSCSVSERNPHGALLAVALSALFARRRRHGRRR